MRPICWKRSATARLTGARRLAVEMPARDPGHNLLAPLVEHGELRDFFERTLLLPLDAEVRVADLTGGRDHYAVEVISSSFTGLGPVERHRLVYGLFKDVIGGALHALSLSTKSPDD